MKPNVENPGKVVITVATTGGLHEQGGQSPPAEQPDEIVQSAYDCYNAGAAVHHIHARDLKGHPTAGLRYYGEIVSRAKAKCPKMITQVGNGIGSKRLPDGHTTHFTLEERMALLNVQPHPDQLTVDCGTFTFGGTPPAWDAPLRVVLRRSERVSDGEAAGRGRRESGGSPVAASRLRREAGGSPKIRRIGTWSSGGHGALRGSR